MFQFANGHLPAECQATLAASQTVVHRASTADPRVPSCDEKQRWNRLRSLNIQYVDSSEFHQPNAPAIILSDLPAQPSVPRRQRPFRPQPNTPAHLARLCEQPLLEAHQEASLFRQMNYLKYQLAAAFAEGDASNPNHPSLDYVERLAADAEAIRDRLIAANMRLVMSVAGKLSHSGSMFDELLSEGCMVLMKAVEKFNYERGFRFSTYAVTALQRQLYRQVGRLTSSKVRKTEDVSLLPLRGDEPLAETQVDVFKVIDVRADVRQLIARLNERERFIVCARFGIGDQESPRRTFKDIAAEMGICKERVRQIQNRALAKLEVMFEDSPLSQRINEVGNAPDPNASRK